MPGFLLHLQGPMQSYDDTGFGQIRKAGDFPNRAAVLGIVAAALGIPRADDRLVALHNTFRVHMATARRGNVLKDYHTVETDTRRPKTLTWRDYHHDAHFVAFVESEDTTAVYEAVAALKHPVYTAFLGRRSCPPAVPLWPEPVADDGLASLRDAAFAAAHALPMTGERRWGGGRRDPYVVLHLDRHLDDAPPPFSSQRVTHGTRRDWLVAPKRAYVSRPFTRLVLEWPAPPDPPDDQRAYFDAVS